MGGCANCSFSVNNRIRQTRKVQKIIMKTHPSQILILKADKEGSIMTSDSKMNYYPFVFAIKGDKVFVIKQRRLIFNQDSYPISDLKSMKRKILKIEPNTAALQNLKSQGYKVSVKHFRRKKWQDKFEPLLADKKIREAIKFHGGICYSHFSERGGATELELRRGEDKIVVRADCYAKDHFCKRLGTRAALDKLKKLYDIEA
jgi:hypothetical protein